MDRRYAGIYRAVSVEDTEIEPIDGKPSVLQRVQLSLVGGVSPIGAMTWANLRDQGVKLGDRFFLVIEDTHLADSLENTPLTASAGWCVANIAAQARREEI